MEIGNLRIGEENDIPLGQSKQQWPSKMETSAEYLHVVV